jgi:hypothetical protein
MGNLKTSETNLPDTPDLVGDVVTLKILLGMYVRKYAIALPLTDVKRLAVTWVDQPVDVGLESLYDVRRKELGI